MKEIPILYSTPMVQAKLAGRKTVTRRTRGLNMINQEPERWEAVRFFNGVAKFCEKHNWTNEQYIKSPFGQPGDILYAKESWCLMNPEENPVHPPKFYYKADGEDIRVVDGDGFQVYNKNGTAKSPWKSPRFMPKSAARIYDRVISVRPERLQDITEEDAVREGILYCEDDVFGTVYKDYATDASGYGHPVLDFPIIGTAVESFRSLWISINGHSSWAANYWVWRLETEVLSTTGRPANL